MPEILLTLPSYFLEVESRLRRCDWLIHNFHNCDPDAIYRPAPYIYRQEFEGAKYIACIDLNVMQYAVNCVKKLGSNDHRRDACAMLLFCRFANIEIEPSLSMYERINHGVGDIEEALDELAIFRALDNADPNLLAEYMLGNQLSLGCVEVPVNRDREIVRSGLTRDKRLVDWDSIYVLVLGAVSVHINDKVSARSKLEHFLDWMITNFRLSLPIVVYAIRLFGKSRLGGMMKFRLSQTLPERKRALTNMTWDLYLVNSYLRNWSNPDKGREEILFTQDKVVKELLRTAIKIQYADTRSRFSDYLNESQCQRCNELLDTASCRKDRVYMGSNWNPEYRIALIFSLEKDLGVLSEEV